jgi:adenosine/AMP kinase
MLSLKQIESALSKNKPFFLSELNSTKKWEQSFTIPKKPAVSELQTASDTFVPVDKEHTLSIFSNNWNLISDLREDLQVIFGNSYFTCEYVDNFWGAVLTALEPEFIMSNSTTQDRMISDLTHKLGSFLEEIFEDKRYAVRGYNKSNMLSLLQSNQLFTEGLGNLLCDFLQLNIVIINPDNSYYFLCKENKNWVNMFMWKSENKWGSIVHADGKSHFFKDIENLLEKMTMSSPIENIKFEKHLDEGQIKTLKKEIKTLKIKELQNKALDLQISISDKDGKKKLKAILQDEIFYALTGQMLS